MGECAFPSHHWTNETLDHPDYESLVVRCGRCGVGHALEFKRIPPGKVKVHFRVFSADDDDTGHVSREVIMWSFHAYEGTVSRMEQDGLEILRGTPEVGGPY